MDDNVDTAITKIYEQQQTTSGTEEDAIEYLKVLEKHHVLNAIFEDSDIPIKFSNKSWDKIVELMDEEKKYSLAFIVFSVINELGESDIWGIKKAPEDDLILNDIFFNTVLEASMPHDVPFTMSEDDFSQFTDYFNKKEEKNKKLKLNNQETSKGNESDENKKKERSVKKQNDKEEDENEDIKYQKKIEEREDGTIREILTKTQIKTDTVYKKQKPKKKEKLTEKDKNISQETPEILRGKASNEEIKEEGKQETKIICAFARASIRTWWTISPPPSRRSRCSAPSSRRTSPRR